MGRSELPHCTVDFPTRRPRATLTRPYPNPSRRNFTHMLHTHDFTDIRKMPAPTRRLRPGQSLASAAKTARNPAFHESLHVQLSNMTRPAPMAMGASKNTSPKYVAEQAFLGELAEKRGRTTWPLRRSIGGTGGFTWGNLSRPCTARCSRCSLKLTCNCAQSAAIAGSALYPAVCGPACAVRSGGRCALPAG